MYVVLQVLRVHTHGTSTNGVAHYGHAVLTCKVVMVRVLEVAALQHLVTQHAHHHEHDVSA